MATEVLVQPLQPYIPFITTENGILTKNGYDFLNNLYLRVGGSLSDLNAASLQDKTWEAPGTIGSTTHNTGKFTTLQATTSVNFTTTGALTFAPTNASVMNNVAIGGTTPLAGTFTTLQANTSVTFNTTGVCTINPTTASAMNNVSVGATTPLAGTFTALKATTGVVADGGGLKHARVTTGAITAGTSALVTVTWGTAFANTNYTVVASVLDSTTAVASLQVVHIESISTTAVTVRVENTAAGDLTGTLHVIAMHD